MAYEEENGILNILSTNSNKIYCFETTIYNNDEIVLSLMDLDERNIKYEKNFSYEEILNEFSILPQDVKDELINLMYFQVFISGLAKNKKIEINKSGDNLRIEFQDIAKAPKGAEYNVSILLNKI